MKAKRQLIPHPDGSSFLVPLTRGEFAIIDADDAPAVAIHNWNCWEKKGVKYAVRQVIRPDGKRQKLGMHRFVTNCPDGMIPDHQDGDTLNNRKRNLKIVTVSENNSRTRRKITNLPIGVSIKSNHYYVRLHGQYLGSFKELKDAVEAVNRFRASPSPLSNFGAGGAR